MVWAGGEGHEGGFQMLSSWGPMCFLFRAGRGGLSLVCPKHSLWQREGSCGLFWGGAGHPHLLLQAGYSLAKLCPRWPESH